jgi:outer membrane protein assembly factor BamB
MMRQMVIASVMVVGMISSLQAENWPQFRGEFFNSQAQSAIPATWNESTNVSWTIKNPGEGWSSPIVWGDNLFFTAAVLKQPAPARPVQANDEQPGQRRRGGDDSRLMQAVYSWQLYCLDAKTGKEKWSQVLKEGHPPLERHGDNTYATETPVTDGKHIWVYFGMIGLYCCDFDGKVVWQEDLGNYPMKAGWGTSSSPLLYEDTLFLQIDNEEQSFVIAIDKESGKEKWRVNRDEKSQYSTPIIWKNSKRDELVLGGVFTRSYDPRSGKLLWELDMQKGRSSASPVTDGDMLYVGNELRSRGDDDGGGYLYAVKAGGSGNITPAEGETTSDAVAWTLSKSGLQMSSPVICEGHLYLLSRNGGIVNAVDQKTGESVYQKRIPGAKAFWASPWVSDGKVFCPDDSGTTHVLAGGPEFNILHTNTLPGQFWASNAIANGRLYLRSTEMLYCIEQK